MNSLKRIEWKKNGKQLYRGLQTLPSPFWKVAAGYQAIMLWSADYGAEVAVPESLALETILESGLKFLGTEE